MLPDRNTLLNVLREAGNALSTRELGQHFGVKKSQKPELRALLKDLQTEGLVQRTGGKLWRLVPKKKRLSNTLGGKLQINRRGFGFVRLDPADAERAGYDDVFIREENLGSAFDGDKVLVRILDTDERGARGMVVEVAERRQKVVIGRWQQTHKGGGGIVVPRSPLLQRRIRVPKPPPALGIGNFDFVGVEITEYTMPPEDLLGNIVERIGAAHEKGIDVLLLLRDRGIVPEFPSAVEDAAQALVMDTEAELPRREDLRGLPTCTIDPETAKDFDDALSIEPEPGVGWRLWVHIADVSHFVRPGEPIDREAIERSTSVYPIDRVVPMLPEKLSNDLCSLRPKEDRFTMTAEMVISTAGRIVSSDFYSAVIHSDRRFSYEEVQAVYEEKPGARDSDEALTIERVLMLRDCSRALRAARMKRGALDLDIPETEIVFHEDGRVSHLEMRERFEAHRVVEDCMLAANEAVADFLTRRKAPLLYRIHEAADPDRLERLVPTLAALGVRLSVSKKGEITPRDIQAAIESIKHREGGHILRRLILRSLKRAEYSPRNAGHFGLASECYCHFTSPIRRYPDVVVHRQLRAVERAEPLPWPDDEEGRGELKELGRYTSSMEREAADAEMESGRIKAIEFLKKNEGEEYEGFVAGIQNFGLFVELIPSGIEGMVPVRSMRDDHYDPDELGIELVGRRSGNKYRLTDKVRVRIAKADAFAGELELEIVGRIEGGERKPRPGPQRGTPRPAGRKTGGKRTGYTPPTKKTLRKIKRKKR